MPQPIIVRGERQEGENWVFLGREVADDLSLILDSDVLDITLRIYDQGDGTQTALYAPSPFTIGANPAWYNTLQTAGWSKGGGGYNFKHKVLMSDLLAATPSFKPEGSHTYRCEYSIDTTSSGVLAYTGYVTVRARTSA
jgi:hypothetical protein